jgi:hypothetical protein
MNHLTPNTMNHLTENQERIIALQMHLGNDFFIVETEDAAHIFEGEEDEAQTDFKESGARDFLTFCQDNCNELTELDEDYLILTDEEADEKAKEYILDSLWAFTPNFLASATGIDLEVFEAIQNNGRCESNNDAILRLVDDEDALVEEAIMWDGRGHFLSHYDGNEDSETVNETEYFIYRQN